MKLCVMRCLKTFTHGELQLFGTGNELRDWIHVGDAARLLCSAACVPQARFNIYNGGYEQATTCHVLAQLANAFGKQIQPIYASEAHNDNPHRMRSDCGHARRQLARAPQVTLEDGILYVAWFKECAGLAGSCL